MEYPTAEGDDSRSLGSGLFGAAGLPPKMYSHIQKNWHTSLQPVTLKREPTQTLGDEVRSQHTLSLVCFRSICIMKVKMAIERLHTLYDEH